jgi:Xaa-Pro aminopeptidase
MTMKNAHALRITKALKLLKASSRKEALVISSNPSVIRSRDTHYPYRPNSDLFYFTGSHAEELTLVLRPHAADPVVLIAPPEDKVKNMWEGAPPPLKPLAKSLKAPLLTTHEPVKQIVSLLRGHDAVYLQSIEGTPSAGVKHDLSSRSTYLLRNLPSTLIDVEQFTARLRLFKDPSEVSRIKEAAVITGGALQNVLPLIEAGVAEREIGAFIEYFYKVHGAEPAFGTIVASGVSAATLHYRALSRTLKKGELLLIDTGAELGMYASDITRMIPVGGTTSPELRDLHDIVLRAQLLAIKKVRAGVRMKDVYNVAATELTYGLKYLGILKGNVSQLVKKGEFKPYFPHGIGHSLGIDVHDATPAGQESVLEKGMVITIEPGLYFSKPTGPLPACGVRIEDDVLVTARGHEVLTANAFTKDLDELGMLMSR